jgi:hypothetical protein
MNKVLLENLVMIKDLEESYFDINSGNQFNMFVFVVEDDNEVWKCFCGLIKPSVRGIPNSMCLDENFVENKYLIKKDDLFGHVKYINCYRDKYNNFIIGDKIETWFDSETSAKIKEQLWKILFEDELIVLKENSREKTFWDK